MLVYDLCVGLMTGTPKVSPKEVLWRSRESNLHHGASKKTVCGFPGYKQVSLGWLKICASLSHWYPGSGVVLDFIDSLHPYLLLLMLGTSQGSQKVGFF